MNMFTRLAAVPALVSAPFAAIAAAAPGLGSEEAQDDNEYGSGYEDGLALGLEAFGLAWLQRFTDHGGSVRMQEDGTAMVGWPMYNYSPVCKDNDAIMAAAIEGHGASISEEHQRWRHSTNSNFYDGKMRELLDLLDTVPGGYDAVKLIVKRMPSFGFPRTEAKPVEA